MKQIFLRYEICINEYNSECVSCYLNVEFCVWFLFYWYIWFCTEPIEHSLDNGDGPSIPAVKYCSPEFYRNHQHLVSYWQRKSWDVRCLDLSAEHVLLQIELKCFIGMQIRVVLFVKLKGVTTSCVLHLTWFSFTSVKKSWVVLFNFKQASASGFWSWRALWNEFYCCSLWALSITASSLFLCVLIFWKMTNPVNGCKIIELHFQLVSWLF